MITFDSKAVINPTAFKEVVLVGGVQGATVTVAEKGLVLALRIGGENRILGQYRGGPRYFRTIDAAASLLIQHGIYRFEADVAGWKPKTLTRKGGELLGGTGIEPEKSKSPVWRRGFGGGSGPTSFGELIDTTADE